MNHPSSPEIVVNGEIIPATSIAAEAQHHHAPKGQPDLAWQKATRALVVRVLLLQEARRRRIHATPADLGGGRFESDEEALIRCLLDTEVKVEPPTDDAVTAHWAKDPERFRSPPLWEVSHILCAADPADDTACRQAEARALALTQAVLAEPKSFARLARDESDCSSKDSGGALGQLGPGDMAPEFEGVIKRLAPGEITKNPVRTRFGYHVIRLDARSEGRVLPFDVVRPRLAEALEKAAWIQAAHNFTERLALSADIRGLGVVKNQTANEARPHL